jgi:hypothetical protein
MARRPWESLVAQLPTPLWAGTASARRVRKPPSEALRSNWGEHRDHARARARARMRRHTRFSGSSTWGECS